MLWRRRLWRANWCQLHTFRGCTARGLTRLTRVCEVCLTVFDEITTVLEGGEKGFGEVGGGWVDAVFVEYADMGYEGFCRCWRDEMLDEDSNKQIKTTYYMSDLSCESYI